MLRDSLTALGVFAAVTLVAELAGAANLGVAIGIGQVAFAATVALLLGWPRRSDGESGESADQPRG